MLDTITFILALIGSIGNRIYRNHDFYWHRISIDASIADHAIAKDTVSLYMGILLTIPGYLISITDVKSGIDVFLIVV